MYKVWRNKLKMLKKTLQENVRFIAWKLSESWAVTYEKSLLQVHLSESGLLGTLVNYNLWLSSVDTTDFLWLYLKHGFTFSSIYPRTVTELHLFCYGHFILIEVWNTPVSYTHLDVYKRQVCVCVCVCVWRLSILPRNLGLRSIV